MIGGLAPAEGKLDAAADAALGADIPLTETGLTGDAGELAEWRAMRHE
ncbi:hypothetical protein [Paenibacillus tarimensis]|nr:hypothetical protein [Paenibacillus tarimensis]MCF2945253.1 hypothetical protein [Paenibacillus tarimensis]